MARSLLLLTCSAALLSAHPLEPSVILEQLANPDYAVRERVTHRLLADENLTVQHIAQMMDASESPEQRHRLLDIARHLVLSRIRLESRQAEGTGAIGFSHDVLPAGVLPGLDHSAVQVVQTLPGFPAYDHLRPGDRIVGVDGQPLPPGLTRQEFPALLQKRRSGQTIELTVHRDGSPLTVRLRLASFQALDQMYPDKKQLTLDPQILETWIEARKLLLSGTARSPALRIPPVDAPGANPG